MALFEIVSQASGRQEVSIEEWIRQQLIRFMMEPAHAEEGARRLANMKNEDQIEQTITNWLGRDKRVLNFVSELKGKRRKEQRAKESSIRTVAAPQKLEGVQVYRKGQSEEDEFMNLTAKKRAEKEQQKQQHQQQLEQAKAKQQQQAEKKKKKAQKQNLSAQGSLYIPGRNLCDCQARRHPLLGNCLNCGKVICRQEGEGPCLFCSQNTVSYARQPEDYTEEELLANPDLIQALQHKDKLLEYDQQSAKRTAVYDDQSDYYTAEFNQWLTPEERKTMKKRQDAMIKAREENKRKMCLTFDIAGRRVIVENNTPPSPSSSSSSSIENSSKNSSSSSSSSNSEGFGASGTGMFVNPFVERLPLFTLKNAPSSSSASSSSSSSTSASASSKATATSTKPQQHQQKKKKTNGSEVPKPKRIQHEYFPEESDGTTAPGKH